MLLKTAEGRCFLRSFPRARPNGQQHSDNSALSRFKPLEALQAALSGFLRPLSGGATAPPGHPPKSASGALHRRR
eukprot:916221-Alexandrium_andersonii.AAC.1